MLERIKGPIVSLFFLSIVIFTGSVLHAAEAKTPAIYIKDPANEATTYESKTIVRGKCYNTEKLFAVTAAESRQIYLSPNGDFTTTFTAPNYGSHYIKLIAYNKQNETAVEYLTVNYLKNQTKPGFTVISPENNSGTALNTVHIRGYGVSIKQLLINKTTARLTLKDNKFYFDEELNLPSNGVNRFTITAHTTDDKTLTDEIIVNKVQAYKPGQESKLQIYYPINNFETPLDKVMLRGTCTNINKLYINDNLVKLENEKDFNTEIKLQYGVNNIEIVGIGPNEIAVKEVRSVIRQNPKMDSAVTKASRPSNIPPGTNLNFLDFIMAEKERYEEKLTSTIQKMIDTMIGPNKAIITLTININTDKTKKDADKEMLRNINRFIQSIDCDIVIDNDSKNEENNVRAIVHQNLSRFGNIKQNFNIKFIDFSENKITQTIQNKASARNHNETMASIDILSIKQQVIEQEFHNKFKKMFIELLLLALVSLILVAGLIALYFFIRGKFDILQDSTLFKGLAGRSSETARQRPIEMPPLPQLNSTDTTSTPKKQKRFFSFIDENNIHELKHILGQTSINDNEAMKVVSIIISYLAPDLASKLLMMYEPEVQARFMDMLIEPIQYPALEIEKIQNDIKDRLDGLVGGNKHLLKILDNLSPNSTKSIFDELEKNYPNTFNNLKPSVVIFEDILNLNDIELAVLLKEIDPKFIANVLKNLAPQTKSRLYSLLSPTRKEIIQERLELKGNKISDSEIETSHRIFIAMAQSLDNSGEIRLSKS